LRPVMMTRIPLRARPSAVLSPIPELAPVTTATRSEVSLTAIGTPHLVKRLKTAVCRWARLRRHLAIRSIIRE
jgi:hypothetical protein